MIRIGLSIEFCICRIGVLMGEVFDDWLDEIILEWIDLICSF